MAKAKKKIKWIEYKTKFRLNLKLLSKLKKNAQGLWPYLLFPMTQDYITKCNYFLKVVVYIGNYEYRNRIQLSK